MADSARTKLRGDSDVYVPHVGVTIDGTELSAGDLSQMTELVYRDRLGAVGSVEMTFSNWDSVDRKLTLSESDTFLPGKSLKVALGHVGGEIATVFDGTIAYLQPRFPPEDPPTIVVGGLDKLHSLRTEQRSVVYEEKTDSDVAKEIASRAGLTLRTSTGGQPEPRYPFLHQRNQYDVAFLCERARVRGYELTVDIPFGDKSSQLGFGPAPGQDQPEYELHYGQSLSGFRAVLDVSRQVSEVVVRSWDPVENTLIEASATTANVTALGRPDAHQIASAFSDRKEVITDAPVASMEEADSLAAAVLDDIVRQQVAASGEALGLPRIRAGRRLIVEGLGDRFSGTYYVTASLHRVGAAGYRTQFDCRREERA